MNLSNHFLIAMPTTHDPVFGGSVVYLCEHNERGALGIVINKPTDITIDSLLERLELKLEIHAFSGQPVMFGGPVQDDRGFVLHSPEGNRFSSMLRITDEIAFTTSRDILEALASGSGPSRVLVSIGYAGWNPGQLEQEIGRNGWLTVAAKPDVIFDLPIAERYSAAIKLLGFDPLMLSSESGHA
ncbi:MAG: YqgE/AlgH family protein [Burkholderiaceae bacterium]|jgi:putative transcriptional regulator|nr:YqgE/AlgH family protein [Burkholderiaceae bacterium]